MKIVDISRKTHERNGIETTVDNAGILRLNEKHLVVGLDHKQLKEIIMKYHSGHRTHVYELV